MGMRNKKRDPPLRLYGEFLERFFNQLYGVIRGNNMGFLKRLFGGGDKEYVDTQGIYFYVRCDNCGTITRVRADKTHDLLRVDGGYEWHKTIVDNKCFRRIPTVVTLDGGFNVTNAEISGGDYVTEVEYEAWRNPPPAEEVSGEE